jgi:hypothetical protein
MPEANDIRTTDHVRHEVNAQARLWRVVGFFVGGGVWASLKWESSVVLA